MSDDDQHDRYEDDIDEVSYTPTEADVLSLAGQVIGVEALLAPGNETPPQLILAAGRLHDHARDHRVAALNELDYIVMAVMPGQGERVAAALAEWIRDHGTPPPASD